MLLLLLLLTSQAHLNRGILRYGSVSFIEELAGAVNRTSLTCHAAAVPGPAAPAAYLLSSLKPRHLALRLCVLH
jgi:hypothetical protein